MKTLAMLRCFCLAASLSCVEASNLRHTARQINGPEYLQKLAEAGKQWITEDVKEDMALRANLAAKKKSVEAASTSEAPKVALEEVASTSEAPKLALEEVPLARKAVASMKLETIRNNKCSSFGRDGTLEAGTGQKFPELCQSYCGVGGGKVGAYIVETPANGDPHCYCSTLDECQKTIPCPDCTLFTIKALDDGQVFTSDPERATEALKQDSEEAPMKGLQETVQAVRLERQEATVAESIEEFQRRKALDDRQETKTEVQQRIEAFTKDPERATEALKKDSEAAVKGLQEAAQAVQQENAEASASTSEKATINKATMVPGMVKLATLKEGAVAGLSTSSGKSCTAYDQEFPMTLDTDSKMADACRSACDLPSHGNSGVYAVQKMDGKAMCSCASLDKCGSLKDSSSVTTYVVKA